MYASKADRDADIEEGSQRLAQVIREDLLAACTRFEAAAERLTGADWLATIAHRTGGTAFRVSDLYDPEVNVSYGSWYLRQLLDKYGDERLALAAYNAGETTVDRWLEQEYPALAARAKAEGAEIHWGDESGARSEAARQRGYAPRQDPPEQAVPGHPFRVNLISTITNEGKLRFMLYEGQLTGAVFVLFLTRLLVGATRKIILIVDRLTVHASAPVQAWLYDHQNQLEIVPLPPYTPERNPDEYLNHDVKENLNTEGPAASRGELKRKLRRFLQHVAKLPEHVRAFFKHPQVSYAAAK